MIDVTLAMSKAVERAELAEEHAKAEERYAASVNWWSRYGGIVAVFAGVIGVGVGTFGGVVLGRSVR